MNEALAEDSATKLKNGTGFVDKDGAFLEFEQERCLNISLWNKQKLKLMLYLHILFYRMGNGEAWFKVKHGWMNWLIDWLIDRYIDI